MILADPRNPNAAAIREALGSRLDDVDLDDVHIVIGGDGFMLHAVSEHGLQPAYLGLNAGHLGFMLNDLTRNRMPGEEVVLDEAATERIVSSIRAKRWRQHTFPLLEAEVQTADGNIVVELAVNDVYLERMTGQTGRFRLSVDGNRVVDLLVADGLIFATALGSTAYSFSAGGAPSHPTLRTLHVTAICPHMPRLTPFVLPDSARARVDVVSPERRPVRSVADGRGTDHVTSVTVGFSARTVRFLYFDSHDFTRQMLRKIIQT